MDQCSILVAFTGNLNKKIYNVNFKENIKLQIWKDFTNCKSINCLHSDVSCQMMSPRKFRPILYMIHVWGVFLCFFLHLKKMLLKEMVLKIKPNQKWTCMKPQLMLSWLTDYNQRLRGVAIAVMPSTPHSWKTEIVVYWI